MEAVGGWRRGGGAGRGSGCIVQVHTTSPETDISLAQVQRGSEELLAWKTEARKKPETEVVQIRPRAAAQGSHHHHQEMTSPSPPPETDSPLSRSIMDCDLNSFLKGS